MDLPPPSFSFVIPSVYDGRKLECRIFLPPVYQNIQSTPTSQIHGAIFAHPYAPLGGCYDDPVVDFVSSELYHANFVVGTFNFRGAGDSEGRTSWTSKPELGDYVSFYGFMLQYLHCLKRALAPNDHSAAQPRESTDQDGGLEYPNSGPTAPKPDVHLILGGYSYGSLITSHVPVLDVILSLFESPEASISEIRNIATRIASSSVEQSTGPTDPDLRALTTSISYLLVSPLLPPISQLLTIFTTLSLKVASRTIPCPDPADQLSTHCTLALAGNLDSFVSAAKLERWSDELLHMPGSQFQFRMVDGADHFWRRNERARVLLRAWLSESFRSNQVSPSD
ncbi:uncharacterized protein N7506_007392 [Penicillium brevicompactum]|uniref:uncharacterized protein n=1 Tax=Penicillium brevicompactum TaxID=5074 RepID=UPI0025402AD8|nr:uncharacterized protein N7506_007392 [Penicillium brevicompactum]KAJ5333609.1 hypothetical protein N7506_007392 [Penicillium brevicompactum]